MPFSSALGTCSVHWSIEEQILCRRAHHFFFPLFEILASFFICEMLPICWHFNIPFRSITSIKILLYLYVLCWNKIGMQDQILSSQEPPYHFEPLLTASTIFSGRMFLSSLLLDCKLLEYRNYFCFPHLCIHCSASLYLVHNSCSAIVNEQIIYTDLNIWLPSDIEYESTPDPCVVSLPWAGWLILPRHLLLNSDLNCWS